MSMASTLRSCYRSTGQCEFTPSDCFSKEENAILIALSQELNGLNQDDIMSIVEEFTVATMDTKTPKRSSTKSRLSRLSIASIPIFEGMESDSETDQEEDENEEEEETRSVENRNDAASQEEEETEPQQQDDVEPPVEEKAEEQTESTCLDDEEEEKLGQLTSHSIATHHTSNHQRTNSRRRRSTLADILGGKQRRPSTLAEMWEVGAETWQRNMDTLLKGEWTGQVVIKDEDELGCLSSDEEEEEEES